MSRKLNELDGNGILKDCLSILYHFVDTDQFKFINSTNRLCKLLLLEVKLLDKIAFGRYDDQYIERLKWVVGVLRRHKKRLVSELRLYILEYHGMLKKQLV